MRLLLRLRAAAALAAAVAALRLLPFARAVRLFRPLETARDAAEALRAVDSAARFVPGATCLARSLAARALGHPGRIVLGVSRNGGFAAHCWIEGTARGGDFLPVAALDA